MTSRYDSTLQNVLTFSHLHLLIKNLAVNQRIAFSLLTNNGTVGNDEYYDELNFHGINQTTPCSIKIEPLIFDYNSRISWDIFL